MIDWSSVFATTSLGAVALAVLGFVARSLFTRYLDRDLAAFKSDLERAATEHSIRYAKFHEFRAEKIMELYGRLVDLNWILHRITQGEVFEQGLEQHRQTIAQYERMANDKYQEFHSCYMKARILLGKQIRTIIEDGVLRPSVDIFFALRSRKIADKTEDRMAFWTEAQDTVRDKINQADELLTRQFHDTLNPVAQAD